MKFLIRGTSKQLHIQLHKMIHNTFTALGADCSIQNSNDLSFLIFVLSQGEITENSQTRRMVRGHP